ncbi:MAG: phosphatidylserine decarboxylase family protein [Bacteroidales bacterium]|nr:phosphatidylserine decarboxylase family protein [Bacteroidales bacterium]
MIDKNSYGTLAVVFFLAAIFIYAIQRLVDIAWLKWALTVLAWVFCIWQLFFFRVPKRNPAGNDRIVTSAADGKVVIVDECFEDEFMKRQCKRVCIYMDFFDVHANFWPVSGEVVYYCYHPGKHILAFKPKASEENEHASSCIRTESGAEVLFKQHAGTFARRIVNYSKPGLKVKAGEQCGIIKFGSRMDIYLPMDADIKVKTGDRALACETVIAEIR